MPLQKRRKSAARHRKPLNPHSTFFIRLCPQESPSPRSFKSQRSISACSHKKSSGVIPQSRGYQLDATDPPRLPKTIAFRHHNEDFTAFLLHARWRKHNTRNSLPKIGRVKLIPPGWLFLELHSLSNSYRYRSIANPGFSPCVSPYRNRGATRENSWQLAVRREQVRTARSCQFPQ